MEESAYLSLIAATLLANVSGIKQEEEGHDKCVVYNKKIMFEAPKQKIVEFANSIDPDEAAQNELPHLELHCLPSVL